MRLERGISTATLAWLFRALSKSPPAGVPKGTEPKNYSAPPPLPHADLQLKHMKQGLADPLFTCPFSINLFSEVILKVYVTEFNNILY